MDIKDFSFRLSLLRENANVSAREMSLAIGQNAGYINSIESCRAFPSMESFFLICDYLQITPGEFFQLDIASPKKLNETIQRLQRLTSYQLNLINQIADEMIAS